MLQRQRLVERDGGGAPEVRGRSGRAAIPTPPRRFRCWPARAARAGSSCRPRTASSRLTDEPAVPATARPAACARTTSAIPCPTTTSRSPAGCTATGCRWGSTCCPPGGRRVLEVGVGSGILVPTLTARYPRIRGHGPGAGAPGCTRWSRPAARPRFQQADLLAPAGDGRPARRALRRHRLLLGAGAHRRRRRRRPRPGPGAEPGRHAGHRLPHGQPADDPGLRRHRLPQHRRGPRQPAGRASPPPCRACSAPWPAPPSPPPPPPAWRSTSARPGAKRLKPDRIRRRRG